MTTEERLSAYLDYFATATFPPVPIQINRYMAVTDAEGFLRSIAAVIRSERNTDSGREISFRHLEELKALCEAGPINA